MNKALIKLIEAGESGTIEFKESFGKDAVEAIAAFANSEGGFLCIGIGNNGNITGVAASEEQIKDWLNQIKLSTDPALFPQYHVFDCEEQKVVLFTVQEYPVKPVSCRGRFLKRHGAANHLLTSDEIVEFKLQSMNTSFDSFNVDGGIDALDPTALDKFRQGIEQSGRYRSTGNIVQDMEKLGFLNDGRLTRAAELLFGNHHTAIHLGRFKSRHTIIDDIAVRAPLMLAVDEAMEFMKRNMRLGYDFTGELKRKETWQYPLPVLRELLLNAIIHKDYRDHTDIIIKMFDEHIEFTNPGGLFGSLKLEALNTDFYRASHRNKLLAEAFYLNGEVEKYGTGFIRIREWLNKEASGLQLLLNSDSGGFWVSVGVTHPSAKAGVEAPDSTTDENPITPPITEAETKILRLLKKHPEYSSSMLAKELSISRDTVKEYLKRLKEKKVLIREGSTRSGRWVVVREV